MSDGGAGTDVDSARERLASGGLWAIQ